MDDIIELIVKYDIPFRINPLHDPDNKIGNEKLIAVVDKIFTTLRFSNYQIKPIFTLFECWNNRNMNSQYCGYGKHYYHFDVEGNVSRCQCEENVAHYTDENLREKIYVKNIFHDECLDCPIFFVCRGGCIHGNKNKQYCDLYKRAAKYFNITTAKKLVCSR